MKHLVLKIIRHPLISGGGVVFIGSFVGSVGNYLYNLLMGRMLSVSDYGLLVSLTSILVLLGLFSNAFTNTFSKFSAAFKGGENEQGLEMLFYYGLRLVGIFGSILFIILLAAVPIIDSFLRVGNYGFIILILLGILFSLLLTLPLGIIQGRMQFIALSVANISQPVIKIIVSVFLLSLGFGVISPLIGLALSSFIPMIILYWFFFSKFRVRSIVDSLDLEKFKKESKKYAYTSFLAGAGMAVLTNIDIILVRYFFNEVLTGQYAALSLMGKAIFYLTLPLNYAFFPLIAYKRERKERLFNTVLLAMGIVTLASVSMSFLYFTFPQIILRIFFPAPEYKILTGYLGLFSLYILIFSLASILFNFFLSIGRTEVYKISIFAGLLQVIVISVFHESLYQIIGGLLAVSMTFFLILLGYYMKHGRD